MTTQFGSVPLIFGDPRQPKSFPLDHPKARFGEWGTKTILLKKGSVKRRGCLALPCDILFERDVNVTLRDGTKIYVDVYRPVKDDVKAPALVAWSPYGKQGGAGNQVLDDFPFRMGVPLKKLSEWQKWEGPDPAYWVQYGYAIVNPDPRGVYNSEGNIYAFGTQEGRDGADVIDWVGSQTWCNGKVAMSGNSYLTISQWYIAAEQPKHLAAIAPWEGSSDYFREASPGGVQSKPALDFAIQIFSVNVGQNSWENPVAMLAKNQGIELKEYLEDKAAKVDKINVPAYCVASWSNPIHSYGTYRAFCRLKTEKWLRVHDSWEWPDYYDEANRTDLHRFYDYYLKQVDNGWTSTPRFRAKIIDTANPLPLTGSHFVSTAFPPPEARQLRLFFNCASRKLEQVYPARSSSKYKAKSEDVVFDYTFNHEVICCGPLEIRLAVSLTGGNDSDIYVTCSKILSNGSIGVQFKVPYESKIQGSLIRAVDSTGLIAATSLLRYEGPWGQANVSTRKIDPVDAVPGLPVCAIEPPQPVEEGQIVLVQPAMRPIGMRFGAGEKFRVVISGRNRQVYPPVDQAKLTAEDVPDVNASGVSVELHSGIDDSSLSSSLVLPVIPCLSNV